MIQRRQSEYGLRGVLWVAKAQGRPDAAVIAKGLVNWWSVYKVDRGKLFLQQRFRTFAAACSFGETLISAQEKDKN